ncbi:MAG: metallophosphoesterase [Chitinophagaceae bacterium]|nr:MAG: metallophosphoesterase [Chitinophagaceae bacterium]
MRNSPFWWVLIVVMVAIDIYVFQALKVIAPAPGSRFRPFVLYGYWILSIGALLTLLLLPYLHLEHQAKLIRSTIFALIAGVFFAKLVAALFFLVDDLRRLFQWGAGKIFFSNTEVADLPKGDGISRSAFLTWTGMLFGGGMFATLVYGFGNKYKYQVKRVPLTYPNLPASFRGLKIIQLSDIHSGSFTNKEAVLKGVQTVLGLKPDLILFTGDLVNDSADEMVEYMDVFSQLKAPMGVYSSLGNHDYGDYKQWDSPEEKIANLARLKEVHKELGWRLLVNEHVALEKGGEKIALIGIENWSAKSNFPKYGDMAKAYAGSESYPFKILMSHDPSHWDAQVLTSYKDVDLMLAGHTHGMQFGIEVPGFKWSPVQYMYKQWAGLYEQANQKLYVNRGYGFIGYPGRVGILPEITLIELT